MQVLEAASRGLPTVGIQHQGIGDHLPEDAGVLVPLQNPTALAKSLAEAIVLLAGDTERRRRLEQGAREFAQAHTADRLFQEILHAYAAATHNYK
jgi:glycosyltransferase involved in cell wall biosynthesis